jgi:hypothetical protein
MKFKMLLFVLLFSFISGFLLKELIAKGVEGVVPGGGSYTIEAFIDGRQADILSSVTGDIYYSTFSGAWDLYIDDFQNNWTPGEKLVVIATSQTGGQNFCVEIILDTSDPQIADPMNACGGWADYVATLSISTTASSSQAEGDAGAKNFDFTVTRNGGTQGTCSANWAVTGTGTTPANAADFGGTFPSGIVNFADGVANQTINVSVSGDTDVEPDEGFTVTLSNPTNVIIATATADGTIQNDEFHQGPDPYELVWAKKAGGSSSDAGRKITIDGDGNILVTGYYSGVSNFGTGDPNATSLISAGGSDIFIAKYNTNGILLWAKRAGGNEADHCLGISTDGSNNSIVAGYFKETATFGPGDPNETSLISAGDYDIFIAKYDPNGALLWAKRAGGTLDDRALAVATDGTGNSLVTGCFVGSATFGPGDPNETTVTELSNLWYDLYVAKYDPNGALLWVKHVIAGGNQQGYSIASDGSNNGLVTGMFQGSIIFGAGEVNETTLTNAGADEIFIAKYDPNGALIWAKRAGGSSQDSGNDIAADAAGNSLVTGVFKTTAIFGAGETNETSLTSNGAGEFFIAKYDPNGTLLWAKQAGGILNEAGFGVVFDSFGNCMVTGEFENLVTFGAGEANETKMVSLGSRDVFVAKYNSNGGLLWVRRDGGTSWESGHGIVVDVSNNSLVAGSFGATATFGMGEPNEISLVSTGNLDILVAKYGQPSGPEIDMKRAGASIPDGSNDILGNQTVATPISLTYTIENVGNENLTLGSVTTATIPAPVNVTLGNVNPQPVSSVTPSNTTTFSIEFTVNAAGAFSFDMDFSNNDGDENPFDFTVSGTGTAPTLLLDFGDAPDPFDQTAGKYPTLLANNGARHKIVTDFCLGQQIDAEADGQQTANADGDDNDGTDDENGVTFGDLFVGTTPNVDVQVKLPAGTTQAMLVAWMDFNADGDWDDTDEKIIQNANVTAGNNTIPINIPASATGFYTFSRFRLSLQPTGDPTGYDDTGGEVEDYRVLIKKDTDGDGILDHLEDVCKICDRDGDGILNIDDYDPSGWIYDETNGNIISGGKINVVGPGAINIIQDGTNGYYQFTVGQDGDYIMSYTPPAGYSLTTFTTRSAGSLLKTAACQPQPGPLDPAQSPPAVNPLIVGLGSKNGATNQMTNWDCSDNPFYWNFRLQLGDQMIINNNIPLAPSQPTGITLSIFYAEVSQDGIQIVWTTESEPKIAGFNVYRCSEENGDYSQVNESLISSLGNVTSGASYSYLDKPDQSGEYYYKLQSVSLDGSISFHGPLFVGLTSVQLKKYIVPDNYTLSQNYPNPFNPKTTIEFGLPKPGFVEISIYDINGKLVRKLVSEQRSAGNHIVKWNANDEPGNRKTSGIYYYQMKCGDYQQTNTMILMK